MIFKNVLLHLQLLSGGVSLNAGGVGILVSFIFISRKKREQMNGQIPLSTDSYKTSS